MLFTKDEEKLINYAHDCFEGGHSPLRPILLKTVGIDVDAPNCSMKLKFFYETMSKLCDLKK